MMLAPPPFTMLRAQHYGIIYADPPWPFETWSAKGRGRSPKYLTLELEKLAQLPVSALAADDCALIMWIVDFQLPAGLEIGRRWGFEFKSRAFDWIKIGKTPGKFPISMGFATRKGSEQAYLFTKGKPVRLSRAVRQVRLAQRREHSRKPAEFRADIECLYPGPYCELFARERAPVWDSWGNQLDHFNNPEIRAGGNAVRRNNRHAGQGPA